jgi:hypothetical protein
MQLFEDKNIPYSEYISNAEINSLKRYIRQTKPKDTSSSLQRINNIVRKKVKT